MKVLVTGATGFIGSAVVSALAARPGIKVVATSRRKVRDNRQNIQWLVVDELGPGTCWREALQDVHVVVHCAGARSAVNTSFGMKSARLDSVNAEGTENLAWQAAREGVSRIIFISTLKVHGECGGPFTEMCPENPQTDYALSKLNAENQLTTVCRSSGVEYVIIRPPIVYGPGVGGNFRLLQKWARGPFPLLPWALNNKRSMIFLGNLVRFIDLVLEHPGAANNTFLVADGQDLSTAQVLKELRKLYRGQYAGVALPLRVVKMAGWVPGTKGVLARLTGSLQASDSKARYLLGWFPPFSLLEGIRETVAADKNVIRPE